jgi:nucleoside-diphosphate-sugar epimerase
MTVLVTGGAGYLGSVTVPKLINLGMRVRVVDAGHFGWNGLAPVLGEIERIDGDIRDFNHEWLDGVGAVIHLAGLSNDPTADFNQRANMEMNVAGTIRVAEACKAKGVQRLVFASSASVYYTHEGSMDDPVMAEDTPVAPNANYSRSKWLGERALFEMADDTFAPSALRMGTLFGWSPRMRFDLVINTFLKDAVLNGRLTVHQGGEMYRPLLGINDAADGYVSMIHQPIDLIRGRTFNLVHKNYMVVSLAHFVKYVLEKEAGVKIEVDVTPRDPSAPSRSYRMSGDLIRDRLGIRADRGAAEEVVKIWQNLQREKLDLKAPIHYNIAQLKYLIENGDLDSETLRRQSCKSPSSARQVSSETTSAKRSKAAATH